MEKHFIKLLMVFALLCAMTASAFANSSSIEIEKKYRELGGPHGFLGKPVSEERWCADHKGRHRAFQHGHIFLYPNPNIGCHEVHGAILNKYRELGWEYGVLGYPMTDEQETMDKVRYNLFQKGLILWTRERGAFVATYDGKRVDSTIDFESDQLKETPYGNLNEFYKKTKKWHRIDLKTNLDLKTGIPKYRGWQVANFWDGNCKLNGYCLSPTERLIISSAQVLLLQWHLHDLRNHESLRRNIIEKYFNKSSCFQRNWNSKKKKWNYNDWCSEFASYLYKRAGVPVSVKKKQCFWCKTGKHEKLGWCMSSVAYFVDYFKRLNKYKKLDYFRKNHIALRIGDYLTTYKKGNPCYSLHLKGHSMVVLGFEGKTIYIINGNARSPKGEGKNASPEGKNKLVVYGTRDFKDKDLAGVGMRNDLFH